LGFDTRLRIFLLPDLYFGSRAHTLRDPVSLRTMVGPNLSLDLQKKKSHISHDSMFPPRHQPVLTYSLIWPCFAFGKGFPVFRSAALSRRERRGRAIPWKVIGNEAPITEVLNVEHSTRCPVLTYIYTASSSEENTTKMTRSSCSGWHTLI
jgi:hypothetical protein